MTTDFELGIRLKQHHGVIDLGDTEVEVGMSFVDSGLRLVADGAEVGLWDRSRYTLTPEPDGVYVLHAENEELRFKPDSPAEFSEAIATSNPGHEHVIAEGENPAPLTLALFYLLAALTLALGVWAGISMIG